MPAWRQLTRPRAAITRVLAPMALIVVAITTSCSDTTEPSVENTPAPPAIEIATTAQVGTAPPQLADPHASGGSIVAPSNGLLFLDPVVDDFRTASNSFDLHREIYAGLIRISDDPSQPFVGDLAASWTLEPDLKTYTFQLRPDVKFSDGSALTADDVKWSWERALAFGSRRASRALGNIVGAQAVVDGTTNELAGVQVIDGDTLRVELSQTDAYWLANLADPAATVVSRPNVALWHRAWSVVDSAFLQVDADYELPVSAGPFKLVDLDLGSSYTLARNEHYHFQPPALDSLLLSAAAAFEGRLDVDYASTFPSGPSDRVQGITNTVRVPDTAQLNFFAFNPAIEPFADIAVRRAFITAATPMLWNDDIATRIASIDATNQDAAASRLQGSTIVFFEQRDAVRYSTLDDVLQAWEEAFDAKIDHQTRSPDWYQKQLRTGKIGMVYGKLTPAFPSDLPVRWHPSIIAQLGRVFPDAPPDSLWGDVQRRIDDAIAEPDQARREAALADIANFMIDRALLLPDPIRAYPETWTIRPDVRGFGFSPYGGSRFASIWLEPN